MKKIIKSKGTTKSEEILSNLGEKTFLNLWSYPNVYRDEGLKKSGVGKEVCDLLVVCGNHVIIFSIKNIEYPNTGDENTDWKRWSKRAILKSAHQLFVAEKWLDRPERLFLDPKCTQMFPIEIPNIKNRKTHLIVVALGASKRCQRHFNGGIGSLMLYLQNPNNGIIEKDQILRPFTFGDIDPNHNFVHVFDGATLNLTMKELDTIIDFVHYLENKKEFIRSGHFGGAAGEEELLSWYINNSSLDRDRGFFPSKERRKWREGEVVFIDQGHWNSLKSNPKYLAKKKADKISYFWDDLITKFTEHFMDGTILLDEEQNHDLNSLEKGARFMALESRFKRRILSQHFLDAIKNIPPGMRLARSLPPFEENGTPYIFLFVPNTISSQITYEEHKQIRRNLLEGYCLTYYWLNQPFKRLIGIATDIPNPPHDLPSSEDLLFAEIDGWNEELEAEAKHFRDTLKIYQEDKMEMNYFSAVEYPGQNEHTDLKLRDIQVATFPKLSRAERRRQQAKLRKKLKKGKSII